MIGSTTDIAFPGNDDMTFGEKRVRLGYDPFRNNQSDGISMHAAALIDLINDLKHMGPDSSEKARLRALAITAVEEATMWAVKAATEQG